MPAKTDYIRQEQTSLVSQVRKIQTALGNLIDAIKSNESIDLEYLDKTGQDPERNRTIAKYTALKAAVDQVNAMQITVKDQADFLAGYDAATEESPE